MFHVDLIEDKEILHKLISHKDILEGFTTKDKLDKYIDEIGENHICYLLIYKHEVAGVGVCLNLERCMSLKEIYVVDIGFFKEYRGKIALKLSKLALQKFFKENKCKKLVSSIYKSNKKALLNAKWCGFKHLSTHDDKYYLEYKNGPRY